MAENDGVAHARQATESLRALVEHAREGRPAGVDHFDWCADVLDELAVASRLIGEAAEGVTGEQSPTAERLADVLATVLVGHRNYMMRFDRPHGGA